RSKIVGKQSLNKSLIKNGTVTKIVIRLIQFRLTNELVHHIHVHHTTEYNYYHHHYQTSTESPTI
ncbi:unnamed protein product, partial [Rotaria sp. Silwood1]